MDITFETERLYVAPRKSVLFVARAATSDCAAMSSRAL
jgi:hypothetical protein